MGWPEVVLVVWVALAGLALWSLIDILSRDRTEWPKSPSISRTAWLLIILITGGVGGIAYVFLACRRLLAEMSSSIEDFTDEARLRASVYATGESVDTVVQEVRRIWLGRSVASIREFLAEQDVVVEGPDLFDTDGLVPPAPGPDSSLI